jgi:hypothetical protein
VVVDEVLVDVVGATVVDVDVVVDEDAECEQPAAARASKTVIAEKLATADIERRMRLLTSERPAGKCSHRAAQLNT